MEIKQTTIDWMIEQLINKGIFDSNRTITYFDLQDLHTKAKVIQKAQMADMFTHGIIANEVGGLNFEEYYERQYGFDL